MTDAPLQEHETPLSRASNVAQAAKDAFTEAAREGADRSLLSRLAVEFLAKEKARAALVEENINHEAKELVAKLLGESRGK